MGKPGKKKLSQKTKAKEIRAKTIKAKKKPSAKVEAKKKGWARAGSPKRKRTSAGVSSRKPVRKASPELVLTPGGWRPREKVHQLKKGHHVSGKGGLLRIIETKTGRVVEDLGPILKTNRSKEGLKPKIQGKIPGLPDSGWIVYADWTNPGPNPIVYFSTKWVVPKAPTSLDNQSIYLFNGLQKMANGNGNLLLQPVLQWGTTGVGGGNYWSISNWF
jgi:hypothetical protein